MITNQLKGRLAEHSYSVMKQNIGLHKELGIKWTCFYLWFHRLAQAHKALARYCRNGVKYVTEHLLLKNHQFVNISMSAINFFFTMNVPMTYFRRKLEFS